MGSAAASVITGMDSVTAMAEASSGATASAVAARAACTVEGVEKLAESITHP
jgi:hypothetical protein